MTAIRAPKFQLLMTCLLAMGGLTLAACGSSPAHPSTNDQIRSSDTNATSPPTTSTTERASTTTTEGAGAAQCSSSNLTASFGPPNGAAGHTYYAINFLNTGAAPCTLYGFPGVSFLTANINVIGSVTSREGNETPTTITLPPGGLAVATLGLTDPGIPPCSGNAVASFVRVYPPGSFSSYLIPITGISVCSSPSTSSYQDSFVAPVQAASSVDTGVSPYGTCNQLDMSIGQEGAGLGHIGEPVLFRNAGSSTCTMFGYPSITMFTHGNPSGVDYTPNGYLGGVSGSGPSMVTLAPGASASALVEGTDNPIGNATSCSRFDSMQITPPGESQKVTLETQLPGCSTIEVHPVVSGTSGTQS